jgi:hypothetical protein
MKRSFFTNIINMLLCLQCILEKRKRPGQRRKGWTEPTEIKETRIALLAIRC